MSSTEQLQHDIQAVSRRLDAANTELIKLMGERDNLLQTIKLMDERNKQLVYGKISSEEVIHQEITRMNELTNKYLEENNELRARIKAMSE